MRAVTARRWAVTARRWAVACALAVAVAPVLAAGTAAAALEPAAATTVCSALPRESNGGVYARVDGDLVVDGHCWFVGSVAGDVLVLRDGYFQLQPGTVAGNLASVAGSTVSLDGSTVEGDLVAGGALNLHQSTVRGDVRVLDGSRGVAWISSSTLGGNLTGSARAVNLTDSFVLGSVEATTREALRAARVVVRGDLTAHGARLIVHDSTVDGALVADDTSDVLVCRVGVGADLVVRGVRVWSRVGEERTERCRVTVGGSVHVLGNPSSVVLGDVRVTGDLVCAGNTGSLGVVRRPALVVAGRTDCP